MKISPQEGVRRAFVSGAIQFIITKRVLGKGDGLLARQRAGIVSYCKLPGDRSREVGCL